MPRANTYYSEEEDKKILELSKKWGITKEETIKKIVRDFKE